MQYSRSSISNSIKDDQEDDRYRNDSMRTDQHNQSTQYQKPFKPFQNERSSTGLLMSKTQTSRHINRDIIKEFISPRGSAFNFLRGQQQFSIVQDNKRFRTSTTHLLGLSKPVSQTDLPKYTTMPSQNEFQRTLILNKQADQNFVQQIRQKQRVHRIKKTQSCSFLATFRNQHYQINSYPGPGIYNEHQLSNTQPQGDLSIGKKVSYDEQIVTTTQQCNTDFHDKHEGLVKNKFYRIASVLEFNKTQGREEAYQFGIFSRNEIQTREGKLRYREENLDERVINTDIQAQILHQTKYSKPYTVPKCYSMTIQTKRLPKPELMHNQWYKMLQQIFKIISRENYGYKKRQGKLVKIGQD